MTASTVENPPFPGIETSQVESKNESPFELKRMSTGISGLDLALKGGITADRPYLITGGPGTGKTILSMQFLLEGVKHFEPSLYVNFEEPKKEILENLSSLAWHENLGGLHIMTIVPNVKTGTWNVPTFSKENQGLRFDDFMSLIKKTVQIHKIKRMVIDSLTALDLMQNDPLERRRRNLFLMNCLSSMNVTTYLIYEDCDQTDMLSFLSRGIIRMENNNGRRHLEIIKMRGQDFSQDVTPFSIQVGRGIVAYPKIVERVDHPASMEKIRTGISGLDPLCQGGFLKGDVSMLAGSAGTGKTIAGIQFLIKGARMEEPGLLISLEETEEELVRNASNFGYDIRKYQERGLFAIRKYMPVGIDLREHLHRLRDDLNGKSRLVINALNDYRISSESMEYDRFIVELFNIIKGMGVTSLLVFQTDRTKRGKEMDLDNPFVDNIIVLKNSESSNRIRKILYILKMRGSAHSREIREYQITERGLHIQSIEDITGSSINPIRPKDPIKQIFGFEKVVTGGGARGR